MIIVQNKDRKVLSVHTTVPKFTEYYGINTEAVNKYVREKLSKSEGNSVEYRDYFISKLSPV